MVFTGPRLIGLSLLHQSAHEKSICTNEPRTGPSTVGTHERLNVLTASSQGKKRRAGSFNEAR